MKIRRYDIFFADLNPYIGGELKKIQPVLVISKNEMNKYLETVVVCPLTTKLHPKWRSRIQTVCSGKNIEIAIDQIRTISKSRFKNKIGELPKEDAFLVRQLISEMYGQ